jgi:hypothetical protein
MVIAIGFFVQQSFAELDRHKNILQEVTEKYATKEELKDAVKEQREQAGRILD